MKKNSEQPKKLKLKNIELKIQEVKPNQNQGRLTITYLGCWCSAGC